VYVLDGSAGQSESNVLGAHVPHFLHTASKLNTSERQLGDRKLEYVFQEGR
jgi:hypothetical protein